MALLETHLEQISLSANAISELFFPLPKMFTNALLKSHDITTLIRDTEAHERALFSIDPTASSPQLSQKRATRRGTIYPPDGERQSLASRISVARNKRNQSTVARVLGVDMMEEIKKSTARSTCVPRSEIDVEVLLRGAEILCNTYPIAGAAEQVATLRSHYQSVARSVARLEARVAENTAELERLSRSYGGDDDEMETFEALHSGGIDITDEDIERELGEIRELERKKHALEERVMGMEKDLGDLLR